MTAQVATPYADEIQAFGKAAAEFRPNNLPAKPIPGVLQAMDGYAGAGGFSQAVMRTARTFGYRVLLTIFNHWATALDIARRNLGDVTVYNGAIQDLDPLELVPSGYLDLLVASPECIFFSPARGALPINDQKRSTAAEILRFISELRVETLILENVPEIERWGFLDEHNRPIKSRSGELFRAFVQAIRNCGYNVDYFTLSACDYGDPTIRKRWYLIAQRDNRAVRRPKQTHSKGGLVPGTLPHVPARAIIDFATKGNSIFGRSTPHVSKTLKRIRIGMSDQVERAPLAAAYVTALDRFIEVADLYHAQIAELPTEKKLGRKLNRDEKALVREVKRNAQSQHRVLVEQIFSESLGEFTWEQLLLRDGLQPTLDGEHHLLMGTMSSVDPVVTKLYGTGTTSDIDSPLDSLTAGGNHFGIASPSPQAFLVPPNHGATASDETRRHASVDTPLDTITAKNSHGLVDPIMLRANASDKSAWNDAVTPIDSPLRTITGKNNLAVVTPEAVLIPQHNFGKESVGSLGTPLPGVTAISRHAVASADATAVPEGFIASYYGPKGDEHRAPRSLSQPLATQTGDNTFAFVEPVLVSQHTTYNENPDLDSPLVTASTRGAGYIAQPYMVSRNEQSAEHHNRTHSLDQPVSTVTGSGTDYLVDPVIIPAHRGVDVDEIGRPVRTITAKGGSGIAFPVPDSFLTPNFGERETQKPRTHSLDDPAPTVTSHGAGMLLSAEAGGLPSGTPFVIISGTVIQIDVLYRMLHREELLKAHSLKTDEHDFDTSGVSESVAVKLVGNGVAVRVASALIREALQYRFAIDAPALAIAA